MVTADGASVKVSSTGVYYTDCEQKIMSIVVVGLTPTVQRTQRFATLQLGAVNRARETVVTASGKGVNVARVITLLGGPAKLIQIVGGSSGQYIVERLEAEGVPHHSLTAEDNAPTRTCLTILPENGPTTELVEEARPVGLHDVRLLHDAARNALLEGTALCCSGSLPPEVPETFYADLIQEAHRFGLPAVVDAQKAPLRAALTAKPFLVKPNREEAAATLGLTLTGEASTDARIAALALIEAGATWALISMGKAGSFLTDGRDAWQISPPEVAAVNPIGSGDSLCSGFLVAHLQRGLSVPEAVVFATACAAANCLTLTSGVVDPADVVRLQPLVRWEKISL
jgi:tagatose 6-phosphate kinase